MKISVEIEHLGELSTLIQTMDKHRFGTGAIAVIFVLLCGAGGLLLLWAKH